MEQQSSISEWINIIGNFGFPITITLYLFFRFEKKIYKLEMAINELVNVIKKREEK